MNNPLLSVLMTAYNREKYIAEAIESVLNSTFKDFELIIVDDASTDNTVSIASAYAAKDSRIKVYVNEKNLGDYPNRNRAATLAKGEYLKYVDSDDKILKDGLERCIYAMNRFPEAGMGIRYNAKDADPFLMYPEQAIYQHFFEKPFLGIGPGGTILRRDFFEKIGQYPIKYGPANDMYFNLKAVSEAPILLLPFKFYFYRLHVGQEINNKYTYLFQNYNYLKDALYELNLPLSVSQKKWLMNKNRRRFLVNLLGDLLTHRDISRSFKAIQKTNFGFFDLIKAIVH